MHAPSISNLTAPPTLPLTQLPLLILPSAPAEPVVAVRHRAARRRKVDTEPLPTYDPVQAAKTLAFARQQKTVYLAATSSTLKEQHELIHVMIGPRQKGLRPLHEGRLWAGDNDAYVGQFSMESFERHLDRLVPFAPSCLFVACPDFVHDPGSTFAVWTALRHRLAMTHPMFQYAFVAQTGCRPENVPCNADVLFLAGRDGWRQGPAGRDLILHAREELGIPVHVGRVNSSMRMLGFSQMGVQSVDGTYLSYRGLPGLEKITQWIERTERDPDGLWTWTDLPGVTA